MKKSLVLIIFMIFISSLHAIEMSTYNNMDALVEKNDIYFETRTNKKANGYYYWDDKNPKTMSTIINGKFEGSSISYYKNRLVSIEQYNKGKIQQDIEFYYNGTIRHLMYMGDGKLNEKDYLENGNISYTIKQIDKHTSVMINYDSNSVKKLEVIVNIINNKFQIKQCYSLDSYNGRNEISQDKCKLIIEDLKKEKYPNIKSKH